MKISLNEIWRFMEMAPFLKQKESEEVQWIYELVAGDISIPNLSTEDIKTLNADKNYDTELLPSIFTYREILWQPNVYIQPTFCIPQLNIFKVFCEEFVKKEVDDLSTKGLYAKLLLGLGSYCDTAIQKISHEGNSGDIRTSSILGNLRKKAFPIIKFFIYHPMNRKDYYIDALNRLNYAVKIMLTQYNNKYDDLHNPYWNVSVGLLPDSKVANKEISNDNMSSGSEEDDSANKEKSIENWNNELNLKKSVKIEIEK